MLLIYLKSNLKFEKNNKKSKPSRWFGSILNICDFQVWSVLVHHTELHNFFFAQVVAMVSYQIFTPKISIHWIGLTSVKISLKNSPLNCVENFPFQSLHLLGCSSGFKNQNLTIKVEPSFNWTKSKWQY